MDSDTETSVTESSGADVASYRVTAGELRQFVERFERLEAEKKDIADQQKGGDGRSQGARV